MNKKKKILYWLIPIYLIALIAAGGLIWQEWQAFVRQRATRLEEQVVTIEAVQERPVIINQAAAAEIDPLAEIQPLLEAKREELVNSRESLIAQIEKGLLKLCRDPLLVSYLQDTAETLYLDENKQVVISWSFLNGCTHIRGSGFSLFRNDFQELTLEQLKLLASLDLNKVVTTIQKQLQDDP